MTPLLFFNPDLRYGSQSLIIPLALLIHLQADATLDLIENVIVSSQHGSKNGLEVFLQTWCENAESIQGFWAGRIR